MSYPHEQRELRWKVDPKVFLWLIAILSPVVAFLLAAYLPRSRFDVVILWIPLAFGLVAAVGCYRRCSRGFAKTIAAIVAGFICCSSPAPSFPLFNISSRIEPL